MVQNHLQATEIYGRDNYKLPDDDNKETDKHKKDRKMKDIVRYIYLLKHLQSKKFNVQVYVWQDFLESWKSLGRFP